MRYIFALLLMSFLLTKDCYYKYNYMEKKWEYTHKDWAYKYNPLEKSWSNAPLNSRLVYNGLNKTYDWRVYE